MIRNYIIVAWRSLERNKLTTFINLFGLTISIAICLLISLFIYDEVNYDKFEDGYDRIFRVEQHFTADGKTRHWAATPAPFGEYLKNKYSEIESASRIFPAASAFIKKNDAKLKEEYFFMADSSVFETLGLTLLRGKTRTALAAPDAVVLTERLAAKIFGTSDPMNQVIVLNSRPVKVTGILKDLPSNSHLKINLIGSIDPLMKSEPVLFTWFANGFYTYVKLRKNVNLKSLADRIDKGLYTDEIFRLPVIYRHEFHNISSIHLDGNVEKEISQNSDWIFIYIFISVGVLIILLASINYINLTTTKSLERSKEIGLRKTLGAFRKNLIGQFLTESVFMTILSFTAAILIVLAVLPNFNAITDKALALGSLANPFFLLVSIGLIIIIGVLAGIYPAFVISSFEPVTALKGALNVATGRKFSFGLRKTLVIFQFVVSALLVISSAAVINQISFMFDKPLGYDKENVMIVPVYSLSREKLAALRNDLKSNHNITDVSATSAIPGKRVFLKGIIIGDGKFETVRTMCVDEDYLKTMKVEMVQGRNFSRSVVSDSIEGVIFNESAVKYFDLKHSLIGLPVSLAGDPPGPKPCKIVGVAKDFHQASLHTAIEPMIFHVKTSYNSVVIRYSGDESEAVKTVSDSWSKFFPDQLFSHTMLADNLEGLYKSESTLKKLLIVFTFFAIVIAALGLFGLIYFTNTLRKKEVGIRKVLGAGNLNIVSLLSKEYAFLIIISFFISLPLSNFLVQKWLANFAYHTDIPVSIFAIGVFSILLVGLATVFVQGLRAALANPVNNIKTD